MAGVEPWPWSLRELCEIANSRQRNEWERALFQAEVVANYAPNFSDTKRKHVEFSQLNPFADPAEPRKRRRRGEQVTGEAGDRILDQLTGAT